MRVNGINSNNLYIKKVNNNPNPNKKYVSNVCFTGIDRFEKTAVTSFENGVKTFYDNLEKRMEILKPEDVSNIASNIVERTGIGPKSVLSAMDMLTQYSSYKSLKKIEKGLYGKYHYGIKSLPTDGKLFENRNVCLADVLEYISKRNFRYSEQDKNPATILDTEILNSLTDAGIPINEYMKCERPVFIQNFENGYNFLNQSIPIEDFAVEKLERAKHFQKRNGRDILYNLNYVMNGNMLKRLRNNGVKFEMIRPDLKQSPNAKDIAQNLNPIIPDKEDFLKVMKEISINGDVEKEQGEKYVLDFLNDMTEIVTPREYSRYLKNLHSKISKAILQNHRDSSKVFYVIPNAKKSFMLTNYAYKKVNNINETNNIFINKRKNMSETFDKFKKLPNGSTAILMDDYLITGLSMIKEQFRYDFLLKNVDILNKKDLNIIFAPILASKNGKTEFETFINYYKRSGKDIIINSKDLPQYDEKIIYNRERRFNRFQTSSILPYMGTDTNAEEFIPMYEMFLYNPNAQKSCLDNFDDVYDLF